MNNLKKTSHSRLLAFRLIAILLGLLLVCLIGELFFRLSPGLVNDPPAPAPYNSRVPDETFGWYTKEGYAFEGVMHDKCDSAYNLHLTFGKNGFRRWGDPNVKDRKKVLFLGDSYTSCNQTSDDQVYFKIIGDSLPIEVFAYGSSGFGSTQEYLILQKYLDEIKPDIVIWQLCCNDFLDNYWELEKAAAYHVRMKRPYTLEDGSIVRRWAAEFPRNVKPYSYFLYFLIKETLKVAGKFDKPPVSPAEKWIGEQGLKYPLFQRSVNMTSVVMQKMKALLPTQTRLFAFDADNFQPQYDQLRRLCIEHNILFADGLPDYIAQQEQQGKCLRTDDGYHWNNQGNKLVAEFLINFLKNQ